MDTGYVYPFWQMSVSILEKDRRMKGRGLGFCLISMGFDFHNNVGLELEIAYLNVA